MVLYLCKISVHMSLFNSFERDNTQLGHLQPEVQDSNCCGKFVVACLFCACYEIQSQQFKIHNCVDISFKKACVHSFLDCLFSVVNMLCFSLSFSKDLRFC